MAFRLLSNPVISGGFWLFSGLLLGTIALAQDRNYGTSIHQDLTENQEFIRGCRDIVAGARVDIYTNSDLSNSPNSPIETFDGGQQVRLTGVLRKLPNYTAVQIYLDNFVFANDLPVGWVDASKLAPSTQTCYP